MREGVQFSRQRRKGGDSDFSIREGTHARVMGHHITLKIVKQYFRFRGSLIHFQKEAHELNSYWIHANMMNVRMPV